MRPALIITAGRRAGALVAPQITLVIGIGKGTKMVCAFVLALLISSAVALADGGPVPIAPPPYAPIDPAHQFEYHTSFEEGFPGRNAGPINQTSVGIPGFPVTAIGHQMRVRYSEFDLRFRVLEGDKEKLLYVQPNFRQRSPGGWLPGAITEFDFGGVHYTIGYVVAPSDPQPVDLFSIRLKNTSSERKTGALRVLFDGAPTLGLKDSLISDRGKPLAVLEPAPEQARQIWRESGVVDPRCTPYGAWTPAGRSGWYGMPIEYLIKAENGKQFRVCLCFHGTPGIAGFSPSTWPVPNREVVAEVEGDPGRQTLLIDKPSVLEFDGSDTDGDGYIRVKVKATPESRQPAMLNDIFFFAPGAKIDHAKLLTNALTNDALFHVVCGHDRPTAVQQTTEGVDPTVTALQLDYTPDLAPGEEKWYEIRLPAIDKPELQTYGNPYHPYDTGDSWRDSRDHRHPENTAPYGEDVPLGRDPADYAAFGPKDRAVWDAQLAAAKTMTFDKGVAGVQSYWERYLADAVRLDVPEKSVVDTYKHQLAMLALHMAKFGKHPYGLVMGGPFFYWDFCYRDAAYESVALDLSGMHDLARLQLNAYLAPRSKMPKSRWTMGQWDDAENDGLWMTRDGQLDGQGQTLWALFEHARLTGDRKWLSANYDSLRRGAEWIIRAIEKEKKRLGDANHVAYGLLPEGLMEGTPWHHALYFDAWAVLGLDHVSELAAAIGRTDDAERYSDAATALRQALRRTVQMSFRRKNLFVGGIPVCPEAPDDLAAWAMSALVHSTKVLSPHDPLIDAAWKLRENEASRLGGLMDWPYINTDWAIGYIDRGEPDRCTQLFYTYLSLASGTMDWGEWFALNKRFEEFDPPLVAAESDSDMPHSESCSNFIYLFRSMMLREVDNDLHIAPAAPRKWLSPGEHYGVSDAPSHFGKVDYRISMDKDGRAVRATIAIGSGVRPSRLIVHFRVPASQGLKAATVNGKPTAAYLQDVVIVDNPDGKTEIAAELR